MSLQKSAVDQQSFYVPRNDPSYSATKGSIPINKDTLYRKVQVVTADSNGSAAAYADALNARGLRTRFNVSLNTANQRVRWDRCALKVDIKFVTAANGNAGAVEFAPPANPLIALSDIDLTINDSSVSLYNCNRTADWEFWMRMLYHHSNEEIQNMSQTLFTPVWGTNNRYYGSLAGGATASAPVTTAGFAPYERKARWILPAAAAGTENFTYTKIIPFADLFPRIVGSPACFRKMTLSLVWKNDVDLCDKQAGNTDVKMCVMGCQLLLDTYVQTPSQSIESLNDKVGGEPDKISFVTATIQEKNYVADSDIVHVSVPNLQSICLFRPARRVVTANVTYQGSVETLVNDPTGTANEVPSYAEYGAGTPCTTVSVKYGQVTYPMFPCPLREGVSVATGYNLAQLYKEYLFAVDKMNTPWLASLKYDQFRGTNPMIWFKPFANGVKLSDAADLSIHLKGGIGCNYYLCIFNLQSFLVNPDGSVIRSK